MVCFEVSLSKTFLNAVSLFISHEDSATITGVLEIRTNKNVQTGQLSMDEYFKRMKKK